MSNTARILSIDQLSFAPFRPVHPSPQDWRDQFIYFLLLDRFDDGKDRPLYNGVRGRVPLDPREGKGIHGGTLRGIERRLDYLRGLGVTTLWLSPVFKNRVDPGGDLHGYAIQDFLAIDPRFGTKADLRSLVDAAHARGMYVVLDIVINHTGDNWSYKGDAHPQFSKDGTIHPFGFWRSAHPQASFTEDDAVWPAELQNPDYYHRRGMIADWNDREQAVLGDFFNLKDLDLKNPKVLEIMIAIYKYWMLEADIDGYRVDTVKHVDREAAVKFFNHIKEFATDIGKQNFLLFGEIVDSDAVIKTYVGTQSSGGEQLQALDASLDFPLYFVLDEIIKGKKSPAELRARYENIKSSYKHSNGTDLVVTFLDNHDQMSRPYHRFLDGAADPRQAVLGIGYLLTAPGIPNIYYGTEQGFDGGGPPGPYQDNLIRECMFGGRWGAFNTTGQHFFDQRHPLYQAIGTLARLRMAEPALRYGRAYFREISEDGEHFQYPEQGIGFLAFSRILDDKEVLVVMNLRGEKYENHVSLDASLSPAGTLMRNLLDERETALVGDSGGRSVLTLTLAPYEIKLFKKN